MDMGGQYGRTIRPLPCAAFSAIARDARRATIYVTADDYFTLYVQRQAGRDCTATRRIPLCGRLRRQDITPLLKTGYECDRAEAVNAGGSAGAIARVEVDGKPVLLTGSQWKVFEPKPQSSQAFPANNWRKADLR